MKDQGERLKHLVAKFVLKYNYWGYLFSRIRRRPMTGFGSIMGVMAEADGTLTLAYEPTLMSGTDDENLTKVIEHEGMHLLNKHIPRLIRILSNETDRSRKNLKIKVWNIASDCAANQQMKLFEPVIIDGKPWPPQLPKQWDMPENELTEKYFYWLLQHKVVTVEVPMIGGHEGWSNMKGVSDLSSLARKLDHHIQDIIRESVKTFNRERGTLPSHIADLIQGALSPPKAPYYQMIRKWIKGTRYSKYKRCPTRINRKRVYVFKLGGKVIPKISPFPGKMRDMTFDIVVLIDTSGSMSNHAILEGLSGVKNIIEKDRYCYTTILECDAAVEKEYQVKKIRDIQFNIKGRGGTTLRPGLERARELGCDVCLAFTDGYTENINAIPRRALPKKIIWVLGPGSSAQSLNKTGPVVWID
jgi:predicted metal-dependent peptidase